MSGSGTGTQATTDGTFTYNPTDLSTELNRLRLELGDTDENDPYLYDEEIVQVQSEKTSFFLRVAKCCELICSKIARDVKVKLGRFSEDSSEVYQRYKDMAVRFNRLASISYPWSGAISVSEKESIEDDTSLVKPKIKLGIHDI